MDLPPTEEEIVKKWAAVIPKKELEVLQRYAPATPTEYIERGEEWTFLGKIRDWSVWVVRKLFGKDPGIITIFVTVVAFATIIYNYGPPVVKFASDLPVFERSVVEYRQPTEPKYIVFQPPEITKQHTIEKPQWGELQPYSIVSGVSSLNPMAQG